MNTNAQPFWKDEPDNFATIRPSYSRMFGWYAKYMMVVIQLLVIAIPTVILAFISSTLMFIWLAIAGLSFVPWFLRWQQKQKSIQDIAETQKLAGERTGASHIGSTIHVAGHPLLQREQPVVLVLVDEQLNIYGYDNPTPLDSISLENIQSLHRIVHDDDRVPHIDAIDSTAQALKITFLWREQSCPCLFRRMRKVRPIDRYHAIQQKRLQLSS
jgi:hypothetical protein